MEDMQRLHCLVGQSMLRYRIDGQFCASSQMRIDSSLEMDEEICPHLHVEILQELARAGKSWQACLHNSPMPYSNGAIQISISTLQTEWMWKNTLGQDD